MASFKPELFKSIITEKEHKYSELIEQDMRGAIIRSRVQDIEEGEKPTKYFLSKEIVRATKKEIKFLEINGNKITHQNGILEAVCEFYKTLYNQQNIYEDLADDFLKDIQPISDENYEKCEGLLTYDECWEAIKLMNNNKSPGFDGLPVEFYKKLFYLFGEKLVDYYNYAFIWGILTPSQRQALITLLCKNFDLHMLLPHWRPISLLSIDYKIISKAMSLRLKQVLPNVIHQNQKCSVEGRSIHEGCHLIRNIIDYVQDRPKMGLAVLNLDIKKAFDTISHKYIKKVLNAYGFGPQFLQWFNLLCKDVTAKVIVNGFLTDSFSIERGVRQGCSLSPLLYVLCVEPLANAIRKDSQINGFSLPGGDEVKLCQYADDITGFLADLSSINIFLNIVEKFGYATGAKLNKDKCSGIWLGRYSHNNALNKYANLKWELNAKILGIYAGISDLEDANWKVLINSISEQIKKNTERNLTLKGSAIILNANILSRMWYKATILGIPSCFIKQLQVLINSFMWKNKMHLIRREVLELPTSRGGVNLVNIPTKIDALRIKHIID